MLYAVRAMMYGHGDVEPGLLRNDTVDLVEVGFSPHLPTGFALNY